MERKMKRKMKRPDPNGRYEVGFFGETYIDTDTIERDVTPAEAVAVVLNDIKRIAAILPEESGEPYKGYTLQRDNESWLFDAGTNGWKPDRRELQDGHIWTGM